MPHNFLNMLESNITPLLAVDGFTALSGRLWRRSLGPVINFVEIQIKSDESAACVNMGVHFDFLPPVGKSQVVGVCDLSFVDCEIRRRLAPLGESDHWWLFEDANVQASKMAECYAMIGRRFFQAFGDFPHPFVNITLNDARSGNKAELFSLMTKVRRVLLLARLHDYLGNPDEVTSFCNLGIELAGVASGPKQAFRELLRKHGTS